MKKISFIFAAAIALFSCSQDEQFGSPETGKYVNLQVTTSIPADLKTYATSTLQSHKGGATNVDTTAYDLRYILEVWTKETPARLAYRGYYIVNGHFTSTNATFNLRLLTLDYDFVFWADFIEEQSITGEVRGNGDATNWTAIQAADLFYTTNNDSTEAAITADPTIDPGLTAIALKDKDNEYPDINNDVRDAYYKTVNVDLTSGAPVNLSVTLKRPFGKFRVIALDAVDGYLASTFPGYAALEYTGPSVNLPAGFNAQTGTVDANTTLPVAALYQYGSKTSPLRTEDVIVTGMDADTTKNAVVLSFDYVFAPAAQVVNFDLTAYDKSGLGIKTRSFSNIPIEENKLTTIIGNFFTGTAAMSVIVEDAFDGENVQSIKIGSTLYNTVQEAVAAAQTGQIIQLGDGTYDVEGALSIDKGVKIYGNGADNTKLNFTNPQTVTVPNGYVGNQPAILLDNPQGSANGVNIENLTISSAGDGITVVGTAGGTNQTNVYVNIANVTFDGVHPAGGLSGVQSGRCITVYNGATVNVLGSVFKKFNKNAIDVVKGYAGVSSCEFYGEDWLNNGQVIAQNGVVYREAGTGAVTKCAFYDFTYDSDTSTGVLILGPAIDGAAKPLVGGLAASFGNTFSNCDYAIQAESSRSTWNNYNTFINCVNNWGTY
ncbi:MAG: hypothetical protein LBR34_06320 [Prevotella sp.]|jgi:hypothetical protein|nr:hypothetical protein [Prevotella sp.]